MATIASLLWYELSQQRKQTRNTASAVFWLVALCFRGVFVTFSPWYRWLQVTRREFWRVRAFEKKRIGKEEKKNKEVTKVSHERLTRACFVGKYEYVLVLRTSYHVLLLVPSSIRTSPSRNGIFSRPMTSAVDVRSFWNGTYSWWPVSFVANFFGDHRHR